MAGITLSSAVRSNLLSIQGTAQLLAQTQERLASGKRVNSAVDNPQSFFTAQSLDNRASDLNTLLDSQGLGVQTLKAADEGIKSIQNLVDQAKSTASQALNTVIKTNDIVGTVTLADPTTAVSAAAAAASTETVTINVDGTTTTVTAGALTVSKFVSSINAISGVTANLSGGTLNIIGGANSTVTIASGIGSIATDLGIVGTFSNGVGRTSFENDFNSLLTQIDQLAGDASFNGVNLLNGNNLTVNFNESGTSSLTVTGVTYNAAGLGVSTAAADSFNLDAGVNAKVTQLATATSRLRSQASTFGGNLSVLQNRQDFTKNLINVLETGAAGLTLADTNEEGANLLALQTRQSLGTTALSLAAQGDQNVLRLF